MIAAEVTVKVDIVHSGLFGELISLSGLLRVHALAVGSIILHPLHSLIELILEHLDGLERLSQHELSEPGVELSQLIHVDVESVASADHPSDLLLAILMIQVVLHHFLHLKFLCIRLHQRRGA